MVEQISKWRKSPDSGCLCQAEIVSNLLQVRIDIEFVDPDISVPELSNLPHEWAIVVTQDCDLTQDYNARLEEKTPTLPNILFCEMDLADNLLTAVDKKRRVDSSAWELVYKNKNERFHFFEQPASHEDAFGEVIPELVTDFKRYFTVPTDEVYARLRAGQIRRRCILHSPYLEHFSRRFHYFQSRVALPNDHESA